MATSTSNATPTVNRTFELAFRLVVGQEGGYSNDSHDPGGETKFGICKRDHPQLDIAALTIEQAEEIYRTEYWRPCRCGDLPPVLAILVFDSAVNQGCGTAVRLLQETLGVPADGVLGPRTLASAVSRDPLELTALFLAHRALRYMNTKNFDRFGKGWLKRLFVMQASVWRG